MERKNEFNKAVYEYQQSTRKVRAYIIEGSSMLEACVDFKKTGEQLERLFRKLDTAKQWYEEEVNKYS